jgi:hypothetical protein
MTVRGATEELRSGPLSITRRAQGGKPTAQPTDQQTAPGGQIGGTHQQPTTSGGGRDRKQDDRPTNKMDDCPGSDRSTPNKPIDRSGSLSGPDRGHQPSQPQLGRREPNRHQPKHRDNQCDFVDTDCSIDIHAGGGKWTLVGVRAMFDELKIAARGQYCCYSRDVEKSFVKRFSSQKDLLSPLCQWLVI